LVEGEERPRKCEGKGREGKGGNGRRSTQSYDIKRQTRKIDREWRRNNHASRIQRRGRVH